MAKKAKEKLAQGEDADDEPLCSPDVLSAHGADKLLQENGLFYPFATQTGPGADNLLHVARHHGQ